MVLKQFVTLVILLSLETAGFSQLPGKVNPELTNSFLEKSRKQRNTGAILLSAGLAGTLAVPTFWGLATQNGNGWQAVYAVFVAGLVAIPVSIGFFIASSCNKKRGIRANLSALQSPGISFQRKMNRISPSLQLKISL